MIAVSVVGADAVAAAFARAGVQVPTRMRGAVRQYTAMLQGLVRAGAPVATGQYRASISTSFSGDSGTVFSDHPAANRLEFGFSGADSLGRVYNDPPREHWRPAAEQIEGVFVAAIMREVAAAV